MKKIYVCLIIAVLIITGCELFYTLPTGEITLNKSEYAYGEEISVSLDVTHDPGRVINVL